MVKGRGNQIAVAGGLEMTVIFGKSKSFEDEWQGSRGLIPTNPGSSPLFDPMYSRTYSWYSSTIASRPMMVAIYERVYSAGLLTHKLIHTLH